MKGLVGEIERCTTVDGPGIRTIVFLMGCPLRCKWCHNPENLSCNLQIGWDIKKCLKCLRCVYVCPNGAIKAADNGLVTDRQKCTFCGECVQACPSKARKRFGREMSAEEVLGEVARDEVFYETSRGGITLSGGEPLYQPEFSGAILELCQKRGYHTALDTSGYGDSDALIQVIRHTNLVLFDLKHADPIHHKALTGVDPAIIWDNLCRIDRAGVPVWIRTPIVSGMTDGEDNIIAIAKLVNTFSCVQRWELLPFHRFGEEKYQQLGMPYPSAGIQPPSQERLMFIEDLARRNCIKKTHLR